ncbi:unnamed protein product [Calypogeia fissa]
MLGVSFMNSFCGLLDNLLTWCAWEKDSESSQAEGHDRQQQQQQLLPGLPDDITLGKISPKLPWKTLYTLSSVSRGWSDAIRSRKVYNARVQSGSMETLVAVFRAGHFTNVLWSTRDGSLIKFPPVPHLGGRLLSSYGKIYLLGGPEDYRAPASDQPSLTSVFVLDVAGQGLWKKCASMTAPRMTRHHGFGVDIQGKIYVLEGFSSPCSGSKFCGSEVYDPTTDEWSPIIEPMHEAHLPAHLPAHAPRVYTVGEELFVVSQGLHAYEVHAYRPVKGEWRAIKNFPMNETQGVMFVARGKLHWMKRASIDVYNVEENAWTELHSFSFASRYSSDFAVRLSRRLLVVVGDELLVELGLTRTTAKGVKFEFCLAKSLGFSSEQKEIVWQEAAPLAEVPKNFMYSLFTVLL